MPDDADDGRDARVANLLEGKIYEELMVHKAMGGMDLADKDIQVIASLLTGEIMYAFAVDWAPPWVKPGDVHAWEESGKHFARCGKCLRDSPPQTTSEAARAWAFSHEASHQDN